MEGQRYLVLIVPARSTVPTPFLRPPMAVNLAVAPFLKMPLPPLQVILPVTCCLPSVPILVVPFETHLPALAYFALLDCFGGTSELVPVPLPRTADLQTSDVVLAPV